MKRIITFRARLFSLRINPLQGTLVGLLKTEKGKV